MSTDQTDQAAPVDVLLASIDEVLAEADSVRPTVEPASALAPEPNANTDEGAQPSRPRAAGRAAASERSETTIGPSTPQSGTPSSCRRETDWWDGLYKDQNADLDTNTGNRPNDRRAPAAQTESPGPQPTAAGDEAPRTAVDLDKTPRQADTDPEPSPPDADELEDEVTRRSRIIEFLFVPKTSTADDTPKGPNHRLRQLAYNGTAAGAGWGLGLTYLFECVIDGATTYAVPITAVALAAGVGSIALRIKGGGLMLIGALGLTTLFQMATPAWVTAFGVPLCLWPIDARLRIWLQRADPTSKAWKAVAWALRIPLATAVIALLLHGTN
ncbi:hypothetical protein AB0N77_21235 [Streptomyces misionensis]|uniref:hypothetical protein n=1 Tax=Streptomyces misionensis TaxID=67331 RepID=UPI00341AC6D1